MRGAAGPAHPPKHHDGEALEIGGASWSGYA